MNKEGLKQLLKDNIRLQVYMSGTRLKVEVFFDGEQITRDTCYVPIH